MPQLLGVLLKINLVLLLFTAVYYLFLRKLTFYGLNRFFLLFGIAFSSVYPFVDISGFFQHQQPVSQRVIQFVSQQVNSITAPEGVMYAWDFLVYIFYIGAGCMAIRLLLQLISLYRIHARSESGQIQNYPVRFLKDQVGPFSFWQTIYINPELYRDSEIKTILEHEKIHVRELHTLDILLAEISLICYWFNPGVWLMKKAIKENVEFITDARLLKRGIDRKVYQYSLLAVGGNATQNHNLLLVNNFNFTDLKKRIKMMNAHRSSPFKLSFYVFALPFLLSITLAFTLSSKKELVKAVVSPTKINEIITAVSGTVEKPLNKTKRQRVIGKSSSKIKTSFVSQAVVSNSKNSPMDTDKTDLSSTQKNNHITKVATLVANESANSLVGSPSKTRSQSIAIPASVKIANSENAQHSVTLSNAKGDITVQIVPKDIAAQSISSESSVSGKNEADTTEIIRIEMVGHDGKRNLILSYSRDGQLKIPKND